MDKTTAEIHDCTRKALMDRIVELERDKKTLEEKVQKLEYEINRLNEIIGIQKEIIEG